MIAECELLGRVLGLAIFHGMTLDMRLSRVVYQMLLDKPVRLEDVEHFDPVLYRKYDSLIGTVVLFLLLMWHCSLKYIEETDSVEDLDLCFTHNYMCNGRVMTQELMRHGQHACIYISGHMLTIT